MKIELWCVGKTKDRAVRQLVDIYRKRCSSLLGIEVVELAQPKLGGKKNVSAEEGKAILKRIQAHDYLVLLDEGGIEYTSAGFAKYLDRILQKTRGRLVFLIGGAYGFPQEVYNRADAKLALSKMTFPHDLVRVIFLEQYYRANSILRNMPYHHA